MDSCIKGLGTAASSDVKTVIDVCLAELECHNLVICIWSIFGILILEQRRTCQKFQNFN